MSKERYEREHEWIIDNNKRKTKEESIIVYDEEWNTLDDICELLNRQDKTISDLEAKLAESEKNFVVANNLRKNSDEVLLNYKTEKYGLEKTIQELRKIKLSLPEKEWYYKGFENCERQMSSHIADLTLEVKELKQQLAEKNKEIENIKLCRCVNCKNEYEFMLEGLVEDLEKQIDKDDQDKISFAITQLEKIKDKFREIYNKNRKHHLSVVKCYELVDEQIAELSNENKGKGE